MLKYHEENPSLVQPAQIQAHPMLPFYVKMLMHFQLKDHPIYPGFNGSNLMGGGGVGGSKMSCKVHLRSTNVREY